MTEKQQLNNNCICPPGKNGTDGINGLNGINCWDLNQNRKNDSNEDVNMDGHFSVTDCRMVDNTNNNAIFHSSVNVSFTIILALIGVIISKKLLQHPTDMRDQKNDLDANIKINEDSLLNRLEKIKESIEFYSKGAEDYKQKKPDEAEHVHFVDVGFGREDVSARQHDKHGIRAIKFQARYNLIYPAKQIYEQFNNGVSESKINEYIQSLVDLREELNDLKCKEEIEEDINTLKRVSFQISRFRKKLFPTILPIYFLYLIVIIGIIVFITLSLLEVPDSLIANKYAMLTLVILSLLGILLYPIGQHLEYMDLCNFDKEPKSTILLEYQKLKLKLTGEYKK